MSDCEDTYDAALTLAYHAEALAGLGALDGALTELDTASAALDRASSAYGQAVAWEIRARVLAEAGRGEEADAARVGLPRSSGRPILMPPTAWSPHADAQALT